MNVQAYSLDEIYEKKLFFLMPYYAMRYEKRLRNLSIRGLVNSKECDTIITELKDYSDRLVQAYSSGVISEDEARKLAELARIIINHITYKLDDGLRERMVDIMGGHVIELQEDKWIKQGIDQGIDQGKILARYEDGMPIEQIAIKMNIPIDKVEIVLRTGGLI